MGALRRLLDSKDERRQMAHTARERAEANFTSEAMARRFTQIYDEILTRD